MKVKIEVFDSSGILIDVLVNEIKTAGEHSAEFRPENLASGIYVARINSGNSYESIKMMYLK